MLSEASLQLTPPSTLFNHLSNRGLPSQGFIFTLAVITPAAPLCVCLHSRNHTQETSAKCFLYACACTCGNVWACVMQERGVEGVEYLPSGYDKATQGRQWTPQQQQQTCRGRTDLTAHSEVVIAIHTLFVRDVPWRWVVMSLNQAH